MYGVIWGRTLSGLRALVLCTRETGSGVEPTQGGGVWQTLCELTAAPNCTFSGRDLSVPVEAAISNGFDSLGISRETQPYGSEGVDTHGTSCPLPGSTHEGKAFPQAGNLQPDRDARIPPTSEPDAG